LTARISKLILIMKGNIMEPEIMKVYTQADFNDLPIIDGARQCPTGDYTHVKNFDCCTFGDFCIFGDYSNFAAGSKFGDDCEFGSFNCFGTRCIFGRGCRFGRDNYFGSDCSFGSRCIFGGADVE
jgi:hypothetical protein